MRLVKKLWRFGSRLFNHLRKRDFAIALYELAREFPNWLISFNKATILCAETHTFPEVWDPGIHTRIADSSDIDDISRISGVSSSHVRQMMDQGAVCFISSIGNNPPVGVTWSANGSCYVRGLAFRHDVGPHGYYGYGTVTLPEVRGRGVYLKAKCDKVKYQTAAGGKKFYATIEFTNTYSYFLQQRQGYYPILAITYIKLLCLRTCVVKDLSTGKAGIRFVIREPRSGVTII